MFACMYCYTDLNTQYIRIHGCLHAYIHTCRYEYMYIHTDRLTYAHVRYNPCTNTYVHTHQNGYNHTIHQNLVRTPQNIRTHIYAHSPY